MPSSSETQNPLQVYLAYDYLTVEQHTRALSSINGIYEALLDAVDPDFFWSYKRWPPGWYVRRASALCISSVETGESITIKFDVSKRWLPEIRYGRDELELLLPAWSAVAFAVGAAVTFGMGRWHEYVEIQKTQAEAKKTSIEVDRMEQEIRRMGLPNQTDHAAFSDVNLHVECFRNVVAAPNMKKALVNGITIEQLQSR